MIEEITNLFEKNVSTKPLNEISYDKDNGISLINSTQSCYDFDVLNHQIKTSDTIFFEKNKIIFVEFKRGKIKDLDFRLKAVESIISFYNYLFDSGLRYNLSIPNDIFQIYIVYDRNNSSPARIQAIVASGKKLEKEYRHFFSKYQVIDNDKFKKLFRIR